MWEHGTARPSTRDGRNGGTTMGKHSAADDNTLPEPNDAQTAAAQHFAGSKGQDVASDIRLNQLPGTERGDEIPPADGVHAKR